MTGLKKMTDYRKLRELVTSGTQLSSVTVLDLIDQALEAQEDAIHQTARAEQAEAQVRQVRELHKPVKVLAGWSKCSCNAKDIMGLYIMWPCPTIKALDGEPSA